MGIADELQVIKTGRYGKDIRQALYNAITDLASGFEGAGLSALEYTKGAYIQNNGSTVDLTPISMANWCYLIDECEQFDVYYVKGWSAALGRLWAFADENLNIINKCEWDYRPTEFERIVAPLNAKYFISSSNYSLAATGCVKGDFDTEALKGIGVNVNVEGAVSDLNDLRDNRIYAFSVHDAAHYPPTENGGVLVQMRYRVPTDGGGTIQIFIDSANNMYHRIKWGSDPVTHQGTWGEWVRALTDKDYPIRGKGLPTSTATPNMTDANTAETNAVYTISTASTVANLPPQANTDMGTLLCYSFNNQLRGGNAQIFITNKNKMFTRIRWGGDGGAWSNWKPVGKLVNTSILSMFESMAVIGDSFASGEIYINNVATDSFYQSWVQIMARVNGVDAINYSKGGLTTETWLTSKYGLGKLREDVSRQLYLIALGINDGNHELAVGTLDDIAADPRPNSYIANMATIREAIKAKNPDAIICFITPMRVQSKYVPYMDACITLANHYGDLLMDCRNYSYFTSEEFTNNQVNNHPVSYQYASIADAVTEGLTDAMYKSPNTVKTFLYSAKPKDNNSGLVEVATNCIRATQTREGRVLIKKMYGYSHQDGTPSTSSPVDIKYAKANFSEVNSNVLAPYAESLISEAGLSYVIKEDGRVFISGTASTTTVFNISSNNAQVPKIYKAGTYKITGCPKGGGYQKYRIWAKAYKASDSSINLTGDLFDEGNGVTFTVSDDFVLGMNISIYANYPVSDLEWRPMLICTSDPDYKSFTLTTDIVLRAIEVASTDAYNLALDGKYYIADTLEKIEGGYQITRRIGHIASYNGETITTKWMSSKDVYASGTSPSTEAVVDYIMDVATVETVSNANAKKLLSLKSYDEGTYIEQTGDVDGAVEFEYGTSEVSTKAVTGYVIAEINSLRLDVIGAGGEMETMTYEEIMNRLNGGDN